jgi:hypothetical protein
MNSILGHTGYIADVFLKKFYRAPTQIYTVAAK